MPTIKTYNYVFKINNSEGGACTAEYATSSPPVSGASNYGSFNFTVESSYTKTFSFLFSDPGTVTCYATLEASGKAKSNIGSATGTN